MRSLTLTGILFMLCHVYRYWSYDGSSKNMAGQKMGCLFKSDDEDSNYSTLAICCYIFTSVTPVL